MHRQFKLHNDRGIHKWILLLNYEFRMLIKNNQKESCFSYLMAMFNLVFQTKGSKNLLGYMTANELHTTSPLPCYSSANCREEHFKALFAMLSVKNIPAQMSLL